VSEQSLLDALLILQVSGSIVSQLAGVGSGAMLALNAAPLLVALVLRRITLGNGSSSLAVYALAGLFPLMNGAQLLAATLDVFVPLVRLLGCLYLNAFLTLPI
jgi:hypothetical protein